MKEKNMILTLTSLNSASPEMTLNDLCGFQKLTASFGIFAVLGSHEFHGDGSVRLFKAARFKTLRNEWTEVRPCLIIAGIDDLTARRRRRQGGDPISEALPKNYACAVILLSHTP